MEHSLDAENRVLHQNRLRAIIEVAEVDCLRQQRQTEAFQGRLSSYGMPRARI